MKTEVDIANAAGIVYQTTVAFQRLCNGVQMKEWEALSEAEQAHAIQSFVHIADHPQESPREAYEDWRNDKQAELPPVMRTTSWEDLPEAEQRMIMACDALVHFLVAPKELLTDVIVEVEEERDGESE